MCIRQPFFMSLCTPKLPRIIVSKGNHMSQDTIIRRSRLMGAFVNSTLSLAPLHEGSFGPLRTQRGLLKPHFGNAKDGSNGTFGIPYRSDFRFGRRRPLFFIFIACESLFGCRVVFARTDHLQCFFQNFIASGMQTFDRGMYRYVDPHTRMPGVRIVRIINSETEST